MSQPRTPILKKLSKDARAKARERAKDRTKEKMMKRRSQVNVAEEEAHGHDETINNNKINVNWSSFEVTSCEKEIEELCKKDHFAVCNEFVMNQEDHISGQSYDMIKKLNSSFPVLNHHRSQEAATSIEVGTLSYIYELHLLILKFFLLVSNYSYTW